ncbi:hypothetical protein IWQ57_005561 [Coemansia nantahalensis]|uniref:Uncharacterized protein n=2 Tax=Coemansia TaxID=4863 RepID=A0ACC1L4W0_9FUNG|nr:hypothetical protein IWQ57_005561 [Coemansia nantahalensis]KAJ2800662.1 hypothetical protein H4R21_003089 [Coemansia helicoidea]
MPEKQRKELCAEQVLFCSNVCGGEGLTRETFCNPTTLGAKCQCTNGAEAIIRRYQWPVFQRVCEATHTECQLACDRSTIPDAGKAMCFNACDTRIACNTDAAPDLKMMVDKFDDETASSPKPPPPPPKPAVAATPAEAAAGPSAGPQAADAGAKGGARADVKSKSGAKGPGPQPAAASAAAPGAAAGAWAVPLAAAAIALAGCGRSLF